MKADRDIAMKTAVMYEKRYEPMERILLATKAKVKALEHSLGTMVSVQCSECLVHVLHIFSSFNAVFPPPPTHIK
jgi:hypothetical protein